MVGGLHDVITCAEFQIEIFMGYAFTGGRIFDFPIDFSMCLTTVQRYCAACDTRLTRSVVLMTCAMHYEVFVTHRHPSWFHQLYQAMFNTSTDFPATPQTQLLVRYINVHKLIS